MHGLEHNECIKEERRKSYDDRHKQLHRPQMEQAFHPKNKSKITF